MFFFLYKLTSRTREERYARVEISEYALQTETCIGRIFFYSFLITRNVFSMELTFSEHGRRNNYMFMDYLQNNYASP